ncbi:MAG: hypothetical protein B6D41_02730 [Chloroflexi bacterium UTCFX4]|nr:MAG: hypothetical protein B6D41_02730 [Chloroflexi bacterium UTCFX4]
MSADSACLAQSLRALHSLLVQFEERGIVIDGAAVCLLGEPRMTADVDAVFLLSNDDLPNLLRAAQEVGFVPRINDVESFAERNRLVMLRHPITNVDVDISLGAMPFEIEAVERSRLVRSGKLRVRLPTVEDLIILKAIAHRPKDLVDIQSLINANLKLDRARIENWVKQYAELLEMPELWDDVAKLLER